MFESDLKAISELHEDWVRAELDGRTDALIAMCSEDIVIAPPRGRPILGREAARVFLTQAAAPIESLVIDELTIDLIDGMAVKRARFSTRLAGAVQDVRGWHLWVLRPSWTVAYLTWSIQSAMAQ